MFTKNWANYGCLKIINSSWCITQNIIYSGKYREVILYIVKMECYYSDYEKLQKEIALFTTPWGKSVVLIWNSFLCSIMLHMRSKTVLFILPIHELRGEGVLNRKCCLWINDNFNFSLDMELSLKGANAQRNHFPQIFVTFLAYELLLKTGWHITELHCFLLLFWACLWTTNTFLLSRPKVRLLVIFPSGHPLPVFYAPHSSLHTQSHRNPAMNHIWNSVHCLHCVE